MKPVRIIVAVDANGGFAKKHKIPWHYSEDFAHFQKITQGGHLIMGRNTYDEIKEMKNKRMSTIVAKAYEQDDDSVALLKGRTCHVLSRKPLRIYDANLHNELRAAIESIPDNSPIFVIGGEKLFLHALPFTSRIYMTIIGKDYQCDQFFNIGYVYKNFQIDKGFKGVHEDLSFVEYKRIVP